MLVYYIRIAPEARTKPRSSILGSSTWTREARTPNLPTKIIPRKTR